MTHAKRRKTNSGNSQAHSSNKTFALTPLTTAIVVALSPSGQVLAQDNDVRLEEIIVTATKRELNLQDVPHSIDVLSAVDLQRMGAKDLEATLKALPSVGLTALMPGQNSLVVRGISTGPFEYRTDAQVAVYLDEQPLTFNSQQVGVRNIDMARIENLPGPQGTLFGSSSQTGTIRYITNKPSVDGFGGQVEGTYGTTSGGDDSYDFSGILNIPLGDSFAVRVVGYTSHDGGYVDNLFGTSFSGNYDNADQVGKNINEYDVDGGRLHALWNINEKWSALFTVVAENTDAVGIWDTDEALGDYKVTRFEDEFRTDDWQSTSLTINGDLGFADMSFTVTKFDRDIVYEYDNMTYSQRKDAYWGGGRYRELYNAGDPAYYYYYNYALYDTEYQRSVIFNDQTQGRESAELRFTSSGEGRLQWMLGGYYEEILDKWYYGAKLDNLMDTRAWAYADYLAYYYGYYGFYDYDCYCYTTNPNQAWPLPPTDVGYSDTLDRTVSQTAIFGEVNFDITDDLTITGGMRWAEFDRDNYSRLAFPEGLTLYPDRQAGDGSYSSQSKVDDTIYKIGLRYNLDDDRMLYGLYSEGFRLGGLNSQRAAATGQIPLEYGGDFVHNYEFGLKSQWLDNRLTLNADFFFMTWDDYQQGATSDLWWMSGTVNAGNVETKGLEMQAEWQATDRLTLGLNLFLADPEFKDNWCNHFIDGEQQACVDDGNGNPVHADSGDAANIVAGMTMPNSPEATAFASIYYTVPDVFNGNLWFYLDYSYSSETWNNTNNIRDNDRDGLSPARHYASFSTGLELPNQFDIELNIRNLTDESAYSYVWTGESGNASYFGDGRYGRLRAQDRPRTVWLTLRKGFGDT